ncbi:hypothetical protein KZZ52_38605 [Dactylosporangium sp. AC04546]|uniref:hypothetical protein n=1 Tax=Dactylosporangium sp. AC04546 TaxID=2862460 RepID=UPI001EE000EA|nr:hypothetical protein [Dactylosporangium sp. AC04546]WVK79868.1 hypothetical protein KZZ52_38605 [Dactylosporangium sp. AC04546]
MTQPPPPPGPRPPEWQRPQVPPGGYQVPVGPVAERIPEDLPFVVRHSKLKRAALSVPIVLLLVLVLACAIGQLALPDDANSTSGDAVAVAFFTLCLLLIFGAAVTLQIALVTSGGPVLAASPAGLWIKTRPSRGQAIWLPWEGVERISRRRWGLERLLVVTPRDPRAEGNLGVFTAVDASLLKLFYGSGFTAPLTFADRRESEIMTAITQLSAGRVPIA